jgi:GGDEF domain-containing protein
MLFVLQVLAVRERAERIYWPCVMLAVAAMGFAVLCGIAPQPGRAWLSAGAVAGMATVSVAIAIWSWDHGDRLARRIVPAMLPFGATLLAYTARDAFGAWFVQHALVVLLAGLATTICAMYLLLASRSQARRDPHKRVVQLQEIDPLTGLVNDSVFASRLPELIQRSQRFEHQSVVAILEFTNYFQLRTEFGRKHSLEHLLRLAERLTAMMRTVDTVARVTETRFGLLVDGPVATSRARAMCAKVIAHCITPMAGLPLGMVMKPRIAMALVPMHGAKGPEVMAMLDRMLSEAAGDSSRVILVPEMRETAPAQPSTGSLMESSIDTTLGGGTEFLPTSAGDGP